MFSTDYQPPGQFLEVDGVKIHTVEWPAPGPTTLVLLHGYLAASHIWETMAPMIAEQGCRVLAVDLPGAGYSQRPRHPSYSLEWLAGAVGELLQQLAPAPIILGGHSLGGAVALHTAAKTPGVKGLVLLAPLTYPTPPPDILRPAAHLPGFFKLFFRTIGRPLIRPALRRNFVGAPPATAQRAMELTIAHLDAPGGWYAATKMGLQAAYRRPLEPVLREIQQPALILWGQDDGVHPVAFSQQLVGDMPQAERVVFDNCGHNPHLEQPENCAAAIGDWIRGGVGAGSDPPS